MRRFPSAGPLPGGPAVPLGGLSSRRDTMRLSRTPGEPSGCYPSPARRRPALLLFGQGAGTQGITPLSGPPPSALNGERGGGVTPRAMAARPRPRHPPRRWRALGRTEERPWWLARPSSWCYCFVLCDRWSRCMWEAVVMDNEGVSWRRRLATAHESGRTMSYGGVGLRQRRRTQDVAQTNALLKQLKRYYPARHW